MSFNDRAELTSAFTNSVEDLQNRMMLTAPKGRTALLDAIYLGLSQMRGAHNAKRALLIISDGGDNHSRYSENDIKRFVKEADSQLYAIGIFDALGYRDRTPEELNGPSLLSEMTEMTGGRVFPVEKLERPSGHRRQKSEWSCEINMSWDIDQATKPTTHVGEKSRSSCARREGLPPLNRLRKDRLLRAQP